MLTPMDIHDHQFKKSFRGYNENEVDDFLDKIVEDFEKLLRENERLKNQVYSNEKELEHYRKLEKTLNDTLMVAQRTADEVISAARRNADEIKENTARECQNIREQAQLEANRQIDKAASKRDAILTECDTFVREKKAFLMKLRTLLESELKMTDQTIDDVPKLDEAVKNILPQENISAPVTEPEPVVEPEPEPKPAPEVPTVDDKPSNIVDISKKPVTDETRTYEPVTPNTDKEAAQ